MPAFRMTRRAATGAWLMAWSVVVWWALITALPHNPQSPGLAAERGTRLVLPEGWGFFTRDPREPDLILVRRGADGAWAIEPPHASASNAFGLHRESRALPVESMRLLEHAPVAFAPCTGSWRECLDAAAPVALRNDVAQPLLCGDVAFLKRAPAPWAWADLMRPDDMPTDILRTRIECSHEST
jgi:antimicrobial peptide system SdpA family protein